MPRVLIPFRDFITGERAVRRLLARPRDPRLDVELLAIVDPLTPGKVGVFVSPARAKAQATVAARNWLRALHAQIEAAGVACQSNVAFGQLRDILKREGARGDIDEVVLGSAERDVLRGVRRRIVAHAMARPLVSVS